MRGWLLNTPFTNARILSRIPIYIFSALRYSGYVFYFPSDPHRIVLPHIKEVCETPSLKRVFAQFELLALSLQFPVSYSKKIGGILQIVSQCASVFGKITRELGPIV